MSSSTVKAFVEWTKGMPPVEKMLAFLIVALGANSLYEKVYSEPQRAKFAQSAHHEFNQQLGDMAKESKEFHEKSITVQEKNSDRLYDLLMSGRHMEKMAESKEPE